MISYSQLDSAYDNPNTWDIKAVKIIKDDKKTKFRVANNTFDESLINKIIFYPPNFLERKRFNLDYIFPQNTPFRTQKSMLLEGLLQCFLRIKKGSKEEQKENRRIISAVKFRNQSDRIEYEYNENIRIALIAAAFEALFNLSTQEIRKSFVNSVSLLLGSCTDVKHWAKQFYDIRSRIVHGKDNSDLKYQSSIKGVSKHITHYRVAKTIFDECLKTKLYLMGLYKQYQYDRPYTLPEVERILIPNKKKIDDLLKLNPSDICNDFIKANDYVRTIGSIKYWDESTCNEDCLKIIGFIKNIIEEIIKLLMGTEEIKKGFEEPLQNLLKTLQEEPCDKNLHYTIFLALRRHDEDKDNKNKFWASFVVQRSISIDGLVNHMGKISKFIIE